MDDLKLFGGSRQEMKELRVFTFSKDIRLGFGMMKCAVLEKRKGILERCDGIELPNDEVIQEVDEDGYRYLGLMEGDS